MEKMMNSEQAKALEVLDKLGNGLTVMDCRDAGVSQQEFKDFARTVRAALSAPEASQDASLAQDVPVSSEPVGEAVAWRIDIADGGNPVWCDNEATARAQAFELRKGRYACTIVPLYTTPPAPSAADAVTKPAVTNQCGPAIIDFSRPDTPTEDKGGAWPDDAAIGAAFLSVLRDPNVVWRDTGAKPFIDRIAEQVALAAAAPQAPSNPNDVLGHAPRGGEKE